jgi:hypothetical protein
VDPILDQTSFLLLIAPPDFPLANPSANSLVSPQELALPDQTSPFPLRRFNRVRAPPAYLRDYSCFSVVLSFHEPHTYREIYTNPLW